MILFHGSYVAIEKPDLSFSRDHVDFGRGFYTTPFKEQAKSWATRFKNRKGTGVVSVYEFEQTTLANIKVLQFDEYNETWLDFISLCRTGKDTSDYELVIGGVANDRIFNTLILYFRSIIGKAEALSRLKYENPNSQYCFRSQSILDSNLKYKAGEII